MRRRSDSIGPTSRHRSGPSSHQTPDDTAACRPDESSKSTGGDRSALSRYGRGVLFAFTCLLATTVVVGSPIFGWFPVVRVSAVLSAVLLVGCWAARPWTWSDTEWARATSWTPSRGVLLAALALLSITVWWLIYSRFEAGGIDAVDFTVYFDRPLYQTSLGRPLHVESTDDPRFADLTHLAVHGYWMLVPFSLLYRVHASPLWLLTLAAAAVTVGAYYVYRIVERCGAAAPLAAAAALAFVFDGNTARALNYGFHPEILYAWFVPWALYAGLRCARVEFLVAVVACLLVKEDAIFPLFAVSVALALTIGRTMRLRDRVIFLLVPSILAFLNLTVFYLWVVPRLSPDGQVMYSYFWATAGATPYEALLWLLKNPGTTVAAALTSGFFTLILFSHWYLPVLGWRWILGLVPLVVVYGASDNDQIRGFGIYYCLPLVPFLTIATALGARNLVARFRSGPIAEVTAAVLVLITVLSTGLGYSLRPWKDELRAVPQGIESLRQYEQILVQGGLYPHAGYEDRVQLLTSHDLLASDGRRAAILLATRGSAYPLKQQEWKCLAALDPIAPMPDGLIAVGVTADARRCFEPSH